MLRIGMPATEPGFKLANHHGGEMKKIGILGGMSPESTTLYYEHITRTYTQIRREFHSFPSKVAEIPAFVSKMLHQSLDFHKRSFSPPGVLIHESDGVSHPPTFG